MLSAGRQAAPTLEIDREEAIHALHGLVAQVEAVEVASSGHSDRVARLARRLALASGWSDARADRLYEAALLHDIGKIALRRDVLGKPGRLTDEEHDHVKSHALVGARMVHGVLDPEQATWVADHHERWDGAGYPAGRGGAEISEGGALLAVADSFDAMTSTRAYKPGMGVREALAEMRANAGRQFSPPAVDRLAEVLAAGWMPQAT